MILFGFGKKTVKRLGEFDVKKCTNCKNNVSYQIIKVTTWFTIYFLPIIPYKIKYLTVCPICNKTNEISKTEAKNTSELEGITSDNSIKTQYIGKNETQINYLKQMEELNRNKTDNNAKKG